ncbi:hypothetical protein NDU88_002255 [Pleurodeles waltl]|uniref:Uncharacterized protein n=1 Tax=Pleurodeles waltl TaxID=8319 RepID=A0AAV7UV63_PLEWA|nr:hypothetical protein NDU88_002255 [Pleurodeles waltl]
MRSEDRDPILGLRPRRVLTTARGRRKEQPRAPRPLTRAVASPAARLGDAAASPAVRHEESPALGLTSPEEAQVSNCSFPLQP